MRLISKAYFGVMMLFAAQPALALSCVLSDPIRTFQHASEAEEAYMVVHGKLVFDEAKLPQTDWEHQEATPENTDIPARITGKSLTLKGFKAKFDRKITLNAQCYGPWCGSAATGVEYLAFLEKTATGYILSVNPCGGFGFANPTEKTLKAVVECVQGKPCEAEPY